MPKTVQVIRKDVQYVLYCYLQLL